MNSASTLLRSRDSLVFRDGKPFGMAGALVGGRLPWPMPSTVAGMVRSMVGQARSSDYFDRSNNARYNANVARLLGIGVRALPFYCSSGSETFEPVFPAPADAAVFPARGQELDVRYFSYERWDAGEGALHLPPDWLLAFTAPEKPASEPPPFWHFERFFQWLREDNIGTLPWHKLGIAAGTKDLRVHTAIDPLTGSADDGRLFEAPGLQLAVAQQGIGELGIGLFLDGLGPDELVRGSAFLGGERRVAQCEPFDKAFPSLPPDLFPAGCEHRFLRLLLVTPASFGSAWAPEWLLPKGTPLARCGFGDGWVSDWLTPEEQWSNVPGIAARVRLRSAFVPNWTALSGWDFVGNVPKPMRKIVPAGSVYVIELENPADAARVAAKLWGHSLCKSPQDQRDGFGVTVVGRAERVARGAVS